MVSRVPITDRDPPRPPLGRVRKLADQALDRPNLTFCLPHPSKGRPSVSPEPLRLEPFNANLRDRWFLGLTLEDPSRIRCCLVDADGHRAPLPCMISA